MPAAELLGADGRADADALSKTVIEAHAGAFPGTDARTDDGDARAFSSAVREPDARAVLATDNRSALGQADASALLVGSLLERQEYGCY